MRTVRAPNGGPFTLDGTRTHLVGRKRVAVVDPGPASEDHLREVAGELSGADEVVILVTHDHADHSAGTRRLSLLVDGSVVRILGAADGAQPLTAGQVIETDAGSLVAVPTPGHATPHWALQWPEEGAVFVGDLLLGRGDTTWLGAYPGCVADFMESLRRVEALEAKILYPAHGPPILDAGDAVDRFRKHRLHRLEQLRRLRRAQPHASSEELARALYRTEEGEPLHRAGLRSVEAMLHHLDSEAEGD